MDTPYAPLAIDSRSTHAAAPTALAPAVGQRTGSGGSLDLRLLVGGAVLAQAMDGLSGAWMMQTRGLDSELNPLMRAVFATGGIPTFVVFKIALAAAAAAIFVMLAGSGRGRLARACLLITVGVGLLGWWSNLP